MPRPASRKRPVEIVAVDQLHRAVVAARRDTGLDAAAIITGPREWRMVQRQREYTAHGRFWPGGEETFAGIPVIVRPGLGAPQVLATQGEVEDALGV